MEATSRFELEIEILQTSALPLGYVALWSGRRDLNPRLQPWQGCTLPLSYSRVEFVSYNYAGRLCQAKNQRQKYLKLIKDWWICRVKSGGNFDQVRICRHELDRQISAKLWIAADLVGLFININ